AEVGKDDLASRIWFAVTESVYAQPERLSPPFFPEVGGGGGMKEMNPLLILLHSTSPLPAGVSPTWMGENKSPLRAVHPLALPHALGRSVRPVCPGLKRCEHVSQVESG